MFMKRYIIIPIIFLLLPLQLFSQSTMAELQKVFIFNFIRYTEWPGLENQLTFRIGILGENNELTEELRKSIHQNKIGGRPIEVVEFKNLDNITACHILFVPSNRISMLRRVSRMLAGISVMIITEMNEFVPKHSVINLMVESNGKMTFTINRNEAIDRGLIINNHLFELSKK